MPRRYLHAFVLVAGVGALALPFLRDHLGARSADDARSKLETELEREKVMPPPRPAPTADSLFAPTPKGQPVSNARHELARPVGGGSAPNPASSGVTHVAAPRASTSKGRLMTELELFPQDQAFVTD